MCTKKSCSVLAVLFLASLLVFALPTPALAQDITVPLGDSIQAAIDGAVEGDTIILAEGLYTENIAITKPLTIRGTGAGTIIGSVQVLAPNVAIELLSINGDQANDIFVDYHEVFEYLDANPGTLGNQLLIQSVIMDGGDGTRTGILFDSSSAMDGLGSDIFIYDSTLKDYRIGANFTDSIMGSYITMINNSFEGMTDFAINFDGNKISTSVISIIRNDITAEGDHAIAVYSELADGSHLVITANEIVADSADAISIRRAVTTGNLLIEANNISAGGTDSAGIYLLLAGGSIASIFKNNISDCYYGIMIEDMSDDTDEPAVFRILQNIIRDSSSDGIYVNSVELNEPGSFMVIGNNSFRGNDWAIYIPSQLILANASQFSILGNSFTANSAFSVFAYQDNLNILAPINWWGTADGPSTEPGEEQVTSNVEFDPWIASIEITQNNSSQEVGTGATITVTLLDNDGEPAPLADLFVRFSVNGVNILTQDVYLHYTAGFAYNSDEVGTDTITVEVLFAGEFTGLGGETSVTWTAAELPPPDLIDPVLPVTGSSTLGFSLSSLALILGGAFLVTRKLHHA